MGMLAFGSKCDVLQNLGGDCIQLVAIRRPSRRVAGPSPRSTMELPRDSAPRGGKQLAAGSMDALAGSPQEGWGRASRVAGWALWRTRSVARVCVRKSGWAR